MSVITDLVSYLPAQGAQNGTTLTFGTNFFAGIMPNTPDLCVALFEYPGSDPEWVFGTATPVFSMPRIQIVVRCVEGAYTTGRPLIEQITRTLEAATGTQITSTVYYDIKRLQDPFFMHRDTSRRIYFAVNMGIRKSPGSL